MVGHGVCACGHASGRYLAAVFGVDVPGDRLELWDRAREIGPVVVAFDAFGESAVQGSLDIL